MALTMAAVAVHKGITLDKLEVQVDTCLEEEASHQQKTTFVTAVDLGLGLTEREHRILFNSARRCEVHKLLRGTIEFRENLTGKTQLGEGLPTEPSPRRSETFGEREQN